MKRFTAIVLWITMVLAFLSGCTVRSQPQNLDSTISDTNISEAVCVESQKQQAIDIQQSGTTVEGIEKIYKKYAEDLKKLGSQNSLEYKNIPAIKQLHYKAYDFCTDSYYIEKKISIKNKQGKKAIIVKIYYDKGNCRFEEYQDGIIAYLNVYNMDKDTVYEYNALNNELKKITQAQKKGRNYECYQYGFFTLWGNNAIKGDLNEIDHNGQKIVYSKIEDGYFSDEYWFDAKTGILLKSDQQIKENGVLIHHATEENTVKPDQHFDPIIFTFDENKLTADEQLGQ